MAVNVLILLMHGTNMKIITKQFSTFVKKHTNILQFSLTAILVSVFIVGILHFLIAFF